MISTSKEFDNKIRADTRTFYARICVDGIPLDVGIKSITVYKGSCGTEFTIGAVFAPYAEITLDAPLASLNGKTITVEIGLETTVDSNDNPVIEYVLIGTYTHVDTKNTTSSSTITASGLLTNELRTLYVPSISCPTTIQSILNDIKSQTGIIIITELDTTGVIEVQAKGYTYTEILGYLAGCLGGYVTENAQGNVLISAYSVEPTHATDAGEYTQMPVFDAEPYTVTGITIQVEESGETDDGDIVKGKSYRAGTEANRIICYNPFMTQKLFDGIKDRVIGLSWNSGVANLSHGDVRLESNDVLSATDVAGNTYILPCMNLVIYFDGGVWCDIEAPGTEETENATQGPITQQLEKYSVELMLAKEMIAKRAKVEDLEATNAFISNLSANSATIGQLQTVITKTEELDANLVKANDAIVNKANIDLANVNNAWIENGIIKDSSIGEAAIHDGAITNAKIADATIEAAKIKSINADTITAGTIKTDKLVITGPNGEDSIVKAINEANGVSEAEVNSEKIQAASIEVSDLSAFHAKIANFELSDDAIRSGKESIKDPKSGIYISTTGIGMGDGSLTGQNESPLQAYADGSFKLKGKNSSLEFNTVTGELSINATNFKISSQSVATKDDIDEVRGEITPFLYIDSSRGTTFKNNYISTALTVVIYYGNQRITDSETMKAIFGPDAYLQWRWQRLDDDSFGILSSNDSRFRDNGFIFILSSEDVDTKVTFKCDLIT